MKHYLLSFLVIPFTSWAQQNPSIHSSYLKDASYSQSDVPGIQKNHNPSIRPLGEPSLTPSTESEKLIYDNGKVYVYRLALCINPDYFKSAFYGDMKKARQWVKEAGEYLNTVYQRDLGIRFEVIMDDKLILRDFPENYPANKFNVFYGTQIINQLLGAENYDCGILISSGTNVDGQAALGGVYSKLQKAEAICNSTFSTIAHELGHMFGAKHVHKSGGGLCVEPGKGQSIMSYGDNKEAFSLASAISIRKRLELMPYFPNNKRDSSTIVGGYSTTDNIPYVEESTKTRPILDRKKIRKSYTITEGTRFQFYIPVENAQESFTYGAQNYDIASPSYESNELQPTYPLTSYPCAMFQPYYNMGKNNEWKDDAILIPYSDAFRPGEYHFLLAAADGPRYDLEKIRLNIVKGNAFQLKTNLSMDQYHGKAFSLEWNPCTELYGEDSKVRILLSDDFGQTYKYVLDDQVPNNGKWSGFWPYINIGKVKYRNFEGDIRGGVIKIEVIGEAAYSVSKEKPAEANPNIMYYGGFELSNRSTYVRFNNGPEPYLVLKSKDNVPPMTELEAYHKNTNQKTKVKGTEVCEGNIIRRRWKAELNGTSSTYSQLIVIEDGQADETMEAQYKAEEISLLAYDLYRHKGELGYPIPTLPVMQKLNAAYTDVFTQEGKVQTGTSLQQVEQLRKILEETSEIKDNEIVKPSERHYYKLRNYQAMFGRDYYYYLTSNQSSDEESSFTKEASDATVWRCTLQDDMYAFSAVDGSNMNLDKLFSGCRKALLLDRGYTWGAFTLVNEKYHCGQLYQGGKNFIKNEYYMDDKIGYRTNKSGATSTDFQFVPVEFVEARKPNDARPWNILENKQLLILDDNYSDLFVGKAVNIEQLNYTRQFDNTEWQTLYLPFDTDCKIWTEHCEIACIDELQFTENETMVTYVLMKEGKLAANQPYLIRAKSTGTHTFTFKNVTVKPTEENRAQVASNGYEASMNGNYGVISAENLQNKDGYMLQGNAFQKANGTNDSLPSMRWYLSIATNSGTTLPQSIRLVEKKDAPVGMISIATQEGYGTVYTDKSYVMPDGVTGYRVTQADADSKELKLVQAFKGGETVPAATPLLVKGEKRTYMLYAPNTEAAEGAVTNQENLLLGAATTGTTTAPNGQNTDDFYFYKLYYGDVDNSGVKRLGFYWGAPNGTPFISQANKAYLAVSKSKANRISGFALPGNNTTSITPMENPEKELVVYTITGVRLYPKSIAELKPGVYVVNGQKKIIR